MRTNIHYKLAFISITDIHIEVDLYGTDLVTLEIIPALALIVDAFGPGKVIRRSGTPEER